MGLRLGVEKYYHYFERFGLKSKTGIDVPGESRTIVHNMEDMGPVELATMSFGQSFQSDVLYGQIRGRCKQSFQLFVIIHARYCGGVRIDSKP